MNCIKCKSKKPMSKTKAEFREWKDINLNKLESKTFKPIYLCNSCGAIQDITKEESTQKIKYIFDVKDIEAFSDVIDKLKKQIKDEIDKEIIAKVSNV